MKMNKKLRTILNAAVATSLFAFAACSDYLEDFQDKYDDGNAFAEISSDSDDGSSDSKLSSSNGGDSELSSSSKGNSDVESSDSTDSSSSATDPGSSSSVAESSSSAFKPCTGTVIYDAEEDSVYNRFGRKFITYVREYGSSDWSKTSPDGVTAQLSEGSSLIMPLATYPDTMNIEPWGGFCVEYTGSGVLHADIYRSIEDTPILLYKEMPNINGEKSSFRWSWNENEDLMRLMEEQKNSDLSDGFSLEKVNSIDFTSYSGNSSITIHKITTLKPNVSIDEYLKCDGATFTPQHIEYWSSLDSLDSLQKRTPLKSGSEYQITLLGNNTVLVNHINDQETLAKANGFCIEYSSDKNFLLSFHRYEGTLTNDSANVSIYKGEKKISYILWQDLERRFDSFCSTNMHLLTFSAKQTENDTTNILISRMTLIE